jgi:choline dehydrogenase-like flavoprotein
VGGGMTGLLLARRLHKSGLRVVVLESGGYAETDETNALNETVSSDRVYKGAQLGRARRLGGTSSIWGGALIPFGAHDFETRPHVGMQKWPLQLADILEEMREVEALFGVDDQSYEEEYVEGLRPGHGIPTGDKDISLRFAKFPTFKRRNLANLLVDLTKGRSGPSIWLNATVTSILPSLENGTAAEVVAISPRGKKMRVAAKRFALCAGAIETTRLLLLLDRHTDGRAFYSCRALGRYFFDHISMAVADITPLDATRLNRMAGYRWHGNTMRAMRFELSRSAQREDGVGSCFGHIGIEAAKGTGFYSVRHSLREYQRTGLVRSLDPAYLFRDPRYLLKAGWWRLVGRQMLWPGTAECKLNVVAEQLPSEQHSISLANSTDAFGVPRARINWSITQRDVGGIIAYSRRFNRYWKRSAWSQVGRLQWKVDLSEARPGVPSVDELTDIYHPGGTTRMGENPNNSVVDRNLSIFSVPNISIASASVFPSGPSANPSLVLMSLSIRLANYIARALHK